jgi:hypothetical protein
MGASLLAKVALQSMMRELLHRIREQAPTAVITSRPGSGHPAPGTSPV